MHTIHFTSTCNSICTCALARNNMQRENEFYINTHTHTRTPTLTHTCTPTHAHTPSQSLSNHHDICQLRWRWLLVLQPQPLERTHGRRLGLPVVRLDHGRVHCVLIQGTQEGLHCGTTVPGGTEVTDSLWPRDIP